MTEDGDYSVRSASFDKESDVLNLGFINKDNEAAYKVYVRSVGLETENGMVEIPVDAELDPTNGGSNALSRGGMCPVLWDITGLHYDRKNCKMTDPVLNSQLIEVRDKYIAKDVSGDVNSDGGFSVADLAMMQQFLLGNGTLSNWKAGDLCRDGKIDILDMIAMRQLMLRS